MDHEVTTQPVGNDVAVTVRVHLSTRDANRVFTEGDPLVQLPTGGLICDVDGPPVERTAIFLTELAGLSGGLTRLFVDEAAANTFATAVTEQLRQIGRRLEDK